MMPRKADGRCRMLVYGCINRAFYLKKNITEADWMAGSGNKSITPC